MSVYKLFNNFTASADAAAQLDVQFDGIITAVDWSVAGDLDADGENYGIEVSFLSTNTLGNNDSRGSLSEIRSQASGTPGFIRDGVNKGVSGLRVPVSAGERMFMHGALSGTANVNATCYIHVDDGADPRLRRRR